MKKLILSIMALGLGAVLGGCQTSNQGFDTEKEVDINEVRIILPNEALQRDDFEIEKVIVRETGSYRSERVIFTGGGLTYDRYFHGGFRRETEKSFMKYVNSAFPDASSIAPAQKGYFEMGKMYYTTIQETYEGEKLTCLAIAGDYGPVVQLRGGQGTAGTVYGFYCEPGVIANFGETMLPWIKKVRIR